MRIENWKEKFDELSRCKSWELDKDAFYADIFYEDLKDFISIQIEEARSDERRRVRKEISLILMGSPWLSKAQAVEFILNLLK